LLVRAATAADHNAIWGILEPVIRTGETYTLPMDMKRDDAVAYWTSQEHEVFVADDSGNVVGTYFLCANRLGGGSHVANCGYITAQSAFGRGVARAMCAHSLKRAKERGFKAMQYNFVVSTNERAIKLWQSFGFEIVGRLPDAFKHPTLGFVDALVMFLKLG
jgi:ribosomal protein S18 acetylase RimI-like enzyme